jgi:hypothetical protein
VIFSYKLKLVDASSPESVIFPYKLKLESQQRCLGSQMTKNRTGFPRESDDILITLRNSEVYLKLSGFHLTSSLSNF